MIATNKNQKKSKKKVASNTNIRDTIYIGATKMITLSKKTKTVTVTGKSINVKAYNELHDILAKKGIKLVAVIK